MGKIQLPAWASKLREPRRYKVLYGGRGSGKSYTIARLLLLQGVSSKIRVLCAREFQNSIAESVHFLLTQEIAEMGLGAYYTATNNSIVNTLNGSEFIFKGVKANVDSIKSMTGLTHLWLEEAHTISQQSWDVLIPTLRAEGSEIWVSFNPDSEDDPTYKMFAGKDGKPLQRDDAIILNVNWMDNPWFPDVLRKEKDYLYRTNPELAEHVWGGRCRTQSDAQIMKNKWVVREFEPQAHWEGPYYGADWGFSNDPTTLVRAYIDRSAGELLIRNAEFGYGIELDQLPTFFAKVPGSKQHVIRADNSRPETINHVVNRGYNVVPAEKWSGSVEDGIAFLKSFARIVIHPELTEMVSEAKNYSYKVDRLTGDVMPVIVDSHNHGWDAIRYALQPIIRSGGISILSVL